MLDLLNDVTVLDVTSNVSGPFCTMALADLGATVWKIEPPGGDVVRNWPPFGPDGMSTTFVALNRGKASVVLDLKSDGGREEFVKLATRVDVMVTSLRPGTLEGLGIGHARLKESNPSLIVCDISAFGGRGEHGRDPGFDAVLQAYTGLMDLTGYPDQPPARVGTGILDIGTAMWATVSILAALLARKQGGPAPDTSVTLFGTAVGFLAHHLASAELAGVVPHRIGTAQHNSAPYEAVQACDGMVMIGVTSDILFGRLASAVGESALTADPRFASNVDRVRHRNDLVKAIEARTTTMTCDEVVTALTSAGVPCSKVRTVAELANDPQLDAAGVWLPSPHGGRLAVTPIAVDNHTPAPDQAAPALGADTESVLHPSTKTPKITERTRDTE